MLNVEFSGLVFVVFDFFRCFSFCGFHSWAKEKHVISCDCF